MIDENIAKNIELIEKEKQEYLGKYSDEEAPKGVPSLNENINKEGKEDVEVDEMEFSLTEDEIEEWIIKLTELKVEKNPIELEVDEENSLKINYEGDEE